MTRTPITAQRLETCELDGATLAEISARAAHSISIAFFGTVFDVRFENAHALARFAGRYADFRTDRPPTQTFVAASTPDATYFARGGRAYRWPERLEAAREIDFLVDTMIRYEYFTYAGGHIAFHAAALRIGGRAIAISGVSGGGKTTTTIACVRRGMLPYSDEHCVLAGNVVRAFPRAMNVRPGARATIANDLAFEDGGIQARLVERGPGAWQDVRFADLFGAGIVATEAPLSAIYFIVGRGERPEIEPLPTEDAVRRYFGAFPLGHRGGLERVADALATIRLAPTFALRLGTPDATARAILANATFECGVG